MKRLTIATALLVGTGVASAQPAPEPAPTPLPEPEPAPAPLTADDLEEPPPSPPKPKRVIKRVSPAPPSSVPSTPVESVRRPTGASVGIGVGWNFPTDLQVPNAFSVRFRLGSGLTIEPELALARGDFSREDGLPPPENVTSTEITLGMQVRKPLRERGKADLDLVGGIRIAQESSDPEGEDNTDSSTEFTLNYGLAVGVWVTPHIQVSITALNPIVVASKVTNEQGLGSEPIKTTSSAIGAVWAPDFIAMIHLHL